MNTELLPFFFCHFFNSIFSLPPQTHKPWKPILWTVHRWVWVKRVPTVYCFKLWARNIPTSDTPSASWHFTCSLFHFFPENAHKIMYFNSGQITVKSARFHFSFLMIDTCHLFWLATFVTFLSLFFTCTSEKKLTVRLLMRGVTRPHL